MIQTGECNKMQQAIYDHAVSILEEMDEQLHVSVSASCFHAKRKRMIDIIYSLFYLDVIDNNGLNSLLRQYLYGG